MHYTIRHVTRFTYDTPISESVMEARMQPRSEGAQRCLHFGLSTTPASRVMMYQDHDGNIVHHFNIPGTPLAADASRPRRSSSATPPTRCPTSSSLDAWERLDALDGVGRVLGRAAPEHVRAPDAAARGVRARDRPRARRAIR